WGAVELSYPNSFGYSYASSPGYLNNNTGGITNLQLGCVYNFVDSMYISWAYTSGGVTTYGLDVLDNTSAAALTATWESLIFDGGSRYKQKEAMRLKISCVGLPTGCTVTPFYKLDRGNKVSGTAITTGGTSAMQELNLRYHEISYGFDVTCSSSTLTPPTITG